MKKSRRIGRYFQFPIRVLRLSGGLSQVDPLERERVFDRAIGYAITHLADYTELEGKTAEFIAERYCEVNRIAELEGEERRKFAAACEVLGVQIAQLDEAFIGRCRASHKVVEDLPGSNLLVRVRADLMWEFRRSWDFRDSAILCGVYAGIGDAKCQRLDCQRIRALAMGFASVNEQRLYGQGIPELTERQVRHTLTKLEGRGLFQRATPDLRNFYYSHRLSQEELDSEIGQMAAREKKQRLSVKERQRAIMAQVEELRANPRVWAKKQPVH